MQQQSLTQKKAESKKAGTAAPAASAQKKPETSKLGRLLKQPRSEYYMEAMEKLDQSSHGDTQIIEDIKKEIEHEFEGESIEGVYLGTISKCYLGPPYEVHTLDTEGWIVEHFEVGRPLPGDFEKGRALAMSGTYRFVEIYAECCRAILPDGTVVEVK